MNYELNLDQCADLITAVPNNTMMLQGHMGVGKTSVAGLIHLKKPQHTVFYCDCTTKDHSEHRTDGYSYRVRHLLDQRRTGLALERADHSYD